MCAYVEWILVSFLNVIMITDCFVLDYDGFEWGSDFCHGVVGRCVRVRVQFSYRVCEVDTCVQGMRVEFHATR